MCSRCTNAHGRVKLTREHRVELVGNSNTSLSNISPPGSDKLAVTPRSSKDSSSPGSGAQRGAVGDSEPKCRQHNLHVTHFCRNCQFLCCEQCLNVAVHDTHDVILLYKFLEDISAAVSIFLD